ncbi:MAG TPA: tetratricopeptide repeat protein [Polyangia bacterium]|jgi:hypothetical protein
MKRRLMVGVLALLTLASVPLARPAWAEVDSREMKAREAFAADRYQEALDIFVKLYAEKLHPNYLRNIGRCYQNLGDPDKAISSFHEYLRKAKGVSADERKEVNGYIAEMEDLKRQREAAAAPPPVQPLPSVTPVVTPVSVTTTPVAPPPPPTLTLTAPPPANPPPVEESSPVYKKWWFWTIIAGVVIGGLGVAAATGAFTKTQDASCGALKCE